MSRELKFWENVHSTPHVRCHMSCVTCHLANVTCNVSSFFLLFLPNFLSSPWSICYKQGLPRLVNWITLIITKISTDLSILGFWVQTLSPFFSMQKIAFRKTGWLMIVLLLEEVLHMVLASGDLPESDILLGYPDLHSYNSTFYRPQSSQWTSVYSLQTTV